MENFTDIQQIWLSASIQSLPRHEDVLNSAKHFRRNKLMRSVSVTIAGLLFLATMIGVIIIYPVHMLSTRVGESFIFAACLVLIIANASTVKRFYKYKELSNLEFIAFLEHTQKRQIFYYKKNQVLGLALASAGLLLFVYEAVHTSLPWFIAAYVFLLAYLAFIWLVLRPRMFKKRQQQLESKIAALTSLSKQFK